MPNDCAIDPPPRTLGHPLDRSEGPLYRQVALHLRAAITAETIGVGESLPTEAALARRFGVSLITVRQALRDLEQDGLIRKRSAKKAVVAAATPRLRANVNMNSLADIVANTVGVRLEIRSVRQERSRLAEATFGLKPGTACCCLRGRLLRLNETVGVVTIYFPPHIGSQLVRADFDDVVVFRSVQRRLGIRYTGGRVTVRAAAAGARLAAELGCHAGDPLLINEFVYFGAGREPVELTIAQHRGDTHSVSYELQAD